MKLITVKFSDERNKAFSIKTSVVETDNGKKYVMKEAIYPEGKKHLDNIFDHVKPLKSMFPEVLICPVERKEFGLRFDFIDGISLEKRYREYVERGEKSSILDLMRRQAKWVSGCEGNRCPFHNTPEFEKIFGAWPSWENVPGFQISNFDATAGNIFICDSQPVFIDYEWVYTVPMPADLVLYHCMHDIYFHVPDMEEVLPFEELTKELEIKLDIEEMEKAYVNFHNYIICEESGISFGGKKHRALKTHKSAASLQKEISDLSGTIGALQKVNDEIEQYWRECAQANALQSKEINELKEESRKQEIEKQDLLQRMQQRDAEQQDQIVQWRTAYESVVNSRTWRLAGKFKRILGRK